MLTAVINFVDQDRQWTKAAAGQDKTEDYWHVSFCAHTILEMDLLEVPDASTDARFAENPLVTGEPFIRFYAGAPLVTSEGCGIGSLCILDGIPRRLTDEQAAVLRLLARQLVGRVEMMRHVALQNALIADRERLLTICRRRFHSFFAGPIALSKTGGVREPRRQARDACAATGITGARVHDFETAVGEAAMNAVGEAAVGIGTVSLNECRTVQVRIEDHGAGIPLGDLPKATLRRGYSTAGTMGHGFSMILMTASRIFLLTGPARTTIVLGQGKIAPTTG